MFDSDDFTMDDFLGGAVRITQPRHGYRVSMDTVLLAASIPAKTGDKVMEAGMGSAAASICLAHRVKDVKIKGLDIQPSMVVLAHRNIMLNEMQDRVSVKEGCVCDLSGKQSQYDHIMINPPYLADGKAVRPPSGNKGIAHMESAATLKDWIRFAVHYTRQRGTITLINRVDRLPETLNHLYGRVGDIRLLPLWPRQGQPAKRFLIQAIKGSNAATQLLPGLVLHETSRRYSPEAEKILRYGYGLNLKDFTNNPFCR